MDIPDLVCDAEETIVGVVLAIPIEEYRRLPLGSCMMSTCMFSKWSFHVNSSASTVHVAPPCPVYCALLTKSESRALGRAINIESAELLSPSPTPANGANELADASRCS